MIFTVRVRLETGRGQYLTTARRASVGSVLEWPVPTVSVMGEVRYGKGPVFDECQMGQCQIRAGRARLDSPKKCGQRRGASTRLESRASVWSEPGGPVPRCLTVLRHVRVRAYLDPVLLTNSPKGLVLAGLSDQFPRRACLSHMIS
ncbi:hypothetical protein L2E82_33720 [Cichorium intybus]|uniref:Uncharacterized protein n=1 Tax=Cichorium intybus TaxID=13427 RepID=A0ACB9BL91_CICIN|nr:hypothetical protein L2E82_33720 [Cichorium intybus]